MEQWLASNKTFHIMRDHPNHDTPILGGMWGARWDNLPAPRAADELARVRDKMLKQGLGKSRHGVDQEILTVRGACVVSQTFALLPVIVYMNTHKYI